ncbi:MAG: hypothetical protein M3481_01060 [Actinomycetota bacterium]|nr:hypothetical protein [Actinomycetota bacterium]
MTLLLTFSRGAIKAGLVALAVYLALGRPWGLLGTALAAIPAGAVALVSAYRADLLATTEPTTTAAVAQATILPSWWRRAQLERAPYGPC